ncbi:hypothetical protein CVT24_004623 [Panaeolus cyanescens]|uniref:Uncharacterized protein n=1 Tax=Panaeolus cyanescens TaxID=181874 RepID=A0A409YSJ4_9AGAR|nr:hypothetical protein CVT24_004623 [Panaeolus cyanescens]
MKAPTYPLPTPPKTASAPAVTTHPSPRNTVPSPASHHNPSPAPATSPPSSTSPIPDFKKLRAPKKSRLPQFISGPGTGGYMTYRLGSNPFPLNSNSSAQETTKSSPPKSESPPIPRISQRLGNTDSPSNEPSKQTSNPYPEVIGADTLKSTQSSTDQMKDDPKSSDEAAVPQVDMHIELRATDDDDSTPKPRFRAAYIHSEVNVSVTLRPART